MNTFKKGAGRALSGLLTVSLLIATGLEAGVAAIGSGSAKATSRGYEYVESNPVSAPDMNGMKAVAENEALVLYLQAETSEIAVKYKKTGAVFFSNPPDRGEDTIASASNRDKMSSQLLVSYYNASSTLFTIDNYTRSVEHNDFTVQPIRNGVKITYTLSENSKKYTYPSVISGKRMDEFCARLSEGEANELKRRRYLKISLADAKNAEERKEMERLYPAIAEDNDIYTVRSTKSDSIQQKIHDLFAKAGYTEEELAADNKENGVATEAGNSYRFEIPIVYQLEDDDLLAYIPGSEIEYEAKWPISTITLLPFFGAAGQKEEGYIFVPDGSGALIRLNNGRTNTQGYYARVYGDDYTMQAEAKTAANSGLSLPVFGMNKSGTGMLAVIEDGEAFATLNADVSGKANSYNSVSATFEVLSSANLELGDVLGTADKVLAFGTHIYEGDFLLRYRFLAEDTTYVGMAASYRDYLESRGLLEQAAETTPFVMDVIGSIDKTKSFMGITYEGEVPLTTFDQCAQITDAVLERGVTPVVRYSGWMNGGMSQSAATRLKIQSALGGARGFRDLAQTLAEKNVTFYPDVSFQYSTGDPWFDGFSKKNDTSKAPGGSVALKYDYDVITNKVDKTAAAPYVVSPSRYAAMSARFMEAYKKYGVDGLSVSTFGSQLNSDQNSRNSVDRQTAAQKTAETLATLSGTYSLMGEGANVYAVRHMDYVLNLPENSSRRYICDESVPFLQMVLHGSVAYTGEVFNLSDDMERAKLKAIETGSGLYVQWIYADNSIVKATNFSSLYAVQYQATLDWALEAYTDVADALRGLERQKITGHASLTDAVTKTVYENGTSIYVNYGDTVYTGDGVTVEAKGYTVKGGAA